MILVDATGQAWDVECTEAGIYTTQSVGGGGPTVLLINDLSLASTTYWLSINPPVLPSTSPELITTPGSYISTAPNGYVLYSPSGVPFYLQVQSGRLQTSGSLIVSLRNAQLGREDLKQDNPNLRDAQLGREGLIQSNANLRDAQLGREALTQTPPNLKIAQLGREMLVLPVIHARVAQLGREVLLLPRTAGNANLLVCLVVT